MTRHRPPADDPMRALFVQMRRTRIREAQELGQLAEVPGVVRALTDDEWGAVLDWRRRNRRGLDSDADEV